MAVNPLAKTPNLFAETIAWGPPAWTVIASTTNGTNTAVVAAVAGGQLSQKPPVQHFLCKATITNTTPYSAATTVKVLDGTTAIYQLEIGLTAPLVIDLDFQHRPLPATPGNSLSVVQGPSGGGVQTVSMAGLSVPDQTTYA